MKQMLKDLLTAYKYGVKTMYYHNTRDGATIRRPIFKMTAVQVGLVRFDEGKSFQTALLLVKAV